MSKEQTALEELISVFDNMDTTTTKKKRESETSFFEFFLSYKDSLQKADKEQRNRLAIECCMEGFTMAQEKILKALKDRNENADMKLTIDQAEQYYNNKLKQIYKQSVPIRLVD